jgi:hypothetical protein
MLKPKLRVTRSMPLRSPFLGKSAESKVYPGKKRIRQRPKIMRKTPLVKATKGNKSKVMAIMAIKTF